MRTGRSWFSQAAVSLGATAVCALWQATIAEAQSLQERGWISVSVGMQVAAGGLSDRLQFERFVEQATVDVDYDGEPGAFFDGGVSFRVWKRLGAGVALSRFSREASADIDARIPHPFFDNRHREVTGTANGATRAETAVHLQLTYTADNDGALRVIVSGGPSYFDVEQDLVSGVQYAETFPFDEATFTAADLTRTSATGFGLNVGADIAWMFGRQFGVGGLVRYSRASVGLDTDDRRSIAVQTGGLQAGAGVRIQF